MPCDHSRAQQEEERILFFPDKYWASEKLWTLFSVALPASFSSVSAFFPCPEGTSMLLARVADLNCNSLLTPNKPIFAGEISGGLLISGQHFAGPYGERRRLPVAPGLVSEQVCYPQTEPTVLAAFLTNPGVWSYLFLLNPSSQSLCIESSPGFIQDLS